MIEENELSECHDDLSTVKRALRAKFLRAKQFKDLFRDSTCVVPVSVGQDYHEGEYFEKTIELIRNNFKACTIIVCDTLQRHTMKIYDNRDDCGIYCQAMENGQEWIRRNINTIETLDIPHDIMKWEEWLEHRLYPCRRRQIEELFDEDLIFRDILNETAKTFLERLEKRENESFNHEDVLKYSVEYIKEEMAVMPLWVERGFEFEIYPKERPRAMQLSYEKFVKARHPNLLRRLAIKFSRQKKQGGEI